METLADLLRPDLRAVCIGINPSPVSVTAGHYYQGPIGRRFWQRLQRAGVIEEAGTGREDDAAFLAGIGFTDIVKRPTTRANEITAAEFEKGRELLTEKLRRYRPALLIFTFKKTATSLFGRFKGHGHRPELKLGDTQVFVMPGPYERADRVEAALEQLRSLLAKRGPVYAAAACWRARAVRSARASSATSAFSGVSSISPLRQASTKESGSLPLAFRNASILSTREAASDPPAGSRSR